MTEPPNKASKKIVVKCPGRAHVGSQRPADRVTFRIVARDPGALRPGLSIDCASELLEIVEGPLHR